MVVTGNIVDFEFDRVASGRLFRPRRFNRDVRAHEECRCVCSNASRAGCVPDGKLFVHIFAHRTLAYHFQDERRDRLDVEVFFWRHDAVAGLAAAFFGTDMRIEQQWWVSGTHYGRTANHWLAKLDAARERVMPTLIATYGDHDARLWFQRWRMFYMAVAELVGYTHGNEWGVARICSTNGRQHGPLDPKAARLRSASRRRRAAVALIAACSQSPPNPNPRADSAARNGKCRFAALYGALVCDAIIPYLPRAQVCGQLC